MGNELELYDIFISTFRWLSGLVGGSLLGFLLAAIAVQKKWVLLISWRISGFLKALPILALVPLFQSKLGINEVSRILLITWACFFPVFVSVVESIREPMENLERRLSLTSNSAVRTFKHYLVPRLFAGWLAGIEVSIGIGWLTVVSAEFLGVYSNGPFRGGLGHFVYNAFEVGNDSKGFLGLAVFGLLGLGTTWLWSIISKKLKGGIYDV